MVFGVLCTPNTITQIITLQHYLTLGMRIINRYSSLLIFNLSSGKFTENIIRRNAKELNPIA